MEKAGKIFAAIIKAAKEAEASDVHLTIGVPVKLRIHGILTDMKGRNLEAADIENIMVSILDGEQQAVLKKMGEITCSLTIPKIARCRVHAYRQRGCLAAAIRILAIDIPDAQALFIPDSVSRLARLKKGMVILSGSQGSGKSTTAAYLIDQINRERNSHILTLEKPIEYVHPHKQSIVEQREIGVDTQSSGTAMEAALMEDADVIFLGDMSREDVIFPAIAAAEAGSLVFGVVPAAGAGKAVDYMIDRFPPQYQQTMRSRLAQVINAVIYQELIPLQNLKGRAAVFEVILASPAIRNLIKDGKTGQLTGAAQVGKSGDMQAMDEEIYNLYIKGDIDRDTALYFAQDVMDLERRLI